MCDLTAAPGEPRAGSWLLTSASGGGGSEGLKANFLRKLTAARPGRDRVVILLLDLVMRWSVGIASGELISGTPPLDSDRASLEGEG